MIDSNPALPHPTLNSVPKCHSHTFPERLQEWQSHNFSGVFCSQENEKLDIDIPSASVFLY